MRDMETIVRISLLLVFLLSAAGLIWLLFDVARRNAARRFRNVPFEQVKIGQSFYDFGGEELELREYLKVGELEAQCLRLKERPLVHFNKKDIVKIDMTFHFL